MKLSRKQVQRQSRTLPRLQFQDQKLTSFSGLVVFQALFSQLHLRDRLRRCFRHLKIKPAYDYAIVMLGLVVHLLIGYRKLSDLRYYDNDPMVLRLLGLRKLPDVATLSRMLAKLDGTVVTRLHELLRELVIQRLAALQLRRITLNFDGFYPRHRASRRRYRSWVQQEEEGAKKLLPALLHHCTNRTSSRFPSSIW